MLILAGLRNEVVDILAEMRIELNRWLLVGNQSGGFRGLFYSIRKAGRPGVGQGSSGPNM